MLPSLKALFLTLAVAALFLFTNCGSSNSQARFVNAIPDSSPLDIDFNGTKEFTDIAFPGFSASTYASIPSGSDTIAGYATGTTTSPAFTQTSPVSFSSGSGYTVVATGFLSGTVTLLAPTDNNTEPADGMVAFRIIDASPSGPSSVDVWILANPVTESLSNTTPTFSGLTSPAAPTTATSAYVTMTYNSSGDGYTLFVATHGNTNPLFSFPSLNAGSLSLGSIRTLVLVDSGNGMSSSPLVLDDLN